MEIIFQNLLMVFDFLLSNGHLGQIREARVLLAQICRGESHFPQKLAENASASTRDICKIRTRQIGCRVAIAYFLSKSENIKQLLPPVNQCNCNCN